MVPKRRHSDHALSDGRDDDDDPDQPLSKRRRPLSHDFLATLSDELIIRIFSFLDERCLLAISPVCSRFHRITSDSQLWRPHYYHRFILPRANRIPGFRAASAAAARAAASLSPSLALRERELGRYRRTLIEAAAAAIPSVNPTQGVDWKKQYKLRHNWACGRCAVEQVPVHDGIEQSPPPEWQTLVKVVEGLAVTAHFHAGLRIWDLRTRKVIARASLASSNDDVLMPPTCLAVDTQGLAADGVLDLTVGFHDGTYGVWRLKVRQTQQCQLTLLFRQAKSRLGSLVAIACRYPYVMTATSIGFITLYTFAHSHIRDQAGTPGLAVDTEEGTGKGLFSAPHQLTSLKSHNPRLPLTLSLRKAASMVVASIVYTFEGPDGWAIEIQDLDIHEPPPPSMPAVVNSRVACTLQTPISRWVANSEGSDPSDSGPVRLCYSHPYLLATLPDNCMVLHLCTSTADSLTISPPTRLWGHTSGISYAEITPRGKAVSVSTRGDEIRLWELEGRINSDSVEVRPRRPTDETDDGRMADNGYSGLMDRKNWVGFDNEMVVVLKEAEDGRESLVLYDFT